MSTMTLFTLLTTVLALQSGEPFWDHFLRTAADVGGNIRLILLDVDGDGRQEIFLAPSVMCGNGGCAWYVYSQTTVPNQVRYVGEAGFSTGSYRFDSGTHTLTACWHMSATECALGEYRLEGGTIKALRLGTCRAEEAGCQAELNRMAQWQREEAPSWLSANMPANGRPGKLQWSSRGGARGVQAPEVPDLSALEMTPGPN